MLSRARQCAATFVLAGGDQVKFCLGFHMALRLRECSCDGGCRRQWGCEDLWCSGAYAPAGRTRQPRGAGNARFWRGGCGESKRLYKASVADVEQGNGQHIRSLRELG